jgi:hypothetical protein
MSVYLVAIDAGNARTFLAAMLQRPQTVQDNSANFFTYAVGAKNRALFGEPILICS